MSIDPRLLDGFLAGYLPHLVVLHFGKLEILQRAGDAPSAGARLAALPQLGPETVSRVMHVEAIVAAQKVRPPAPPRSPTEAVAWGESIAKTFTALEARTPSGEFVITRDDIFHVPRHCGALLGDLEHTLELVQLVDALRAESPDHPFLTAQRKALFAGLHAALAAAQRLAVRAQGTPLEGTATYARQITGSALEAARIDAPPAEIAQALATVRSGARSLEASLASRGPGDAIARRRAGEIGQDELLRALLLHPSWYRDESSADDGIVRAFTQPRKHAERGEGGAPPAFAGSGYALVAFAPSTITSLSIDEGTDTALVVGGEEWTSMRGRAFETLIERAWLDWSAVPLALVRSLPHPALVTPDGVIRAIPWSDALQRPFASIFTDPVALRRAVTALPAGTVPEGATITPRPLLEILSALRAASAPGLVVQGAGSERPRTFSRGMIELLASVPAAKPS